MCHPSWVAVNISIKCSFSKYRAASQSRQCKYSRLLTRDADRESTMCRFRLFLGDSLDDFSRLYTALQTAGLAEFLLFTDLRLRLEYPATDGRERLGQPNDLIRYYYAIAHIDITAGLTHFVVQSLTMRHVKRLTQLTKQCLLYFNRDVGLPLTSSFLRYRS